MRTDATSTLGLTFETTAIPENAYTRNADPNPFESHFPSDKEALTLTLPADTDDELKRIVKLRNQARNQAKAVDRSARVTEKTTVHVNPKTKAETKTVTLTIWTVKRIVKPRKNEVTVADTEARVEAETKDTDDGTVPEAPAK